MEDLYLRLKKANLTCEELSQHEVQGCHSMVFKSSHNLDKHSGFHRDVSFAGGASMEDIIKAEQGYKMQGDRAFSFERIMTKLKGTKKSQTIVFYHSFHHGMNV